MIEEEKEKEKVDLLVQMMNDLSAKLHTVHKAVNRNAEDILQLKQDLAFAKGGSKAIIFALGLAGTILAIIKFLG